MPELPEVETVRRGLAPVMEGALVDRLELRRADLRFPFAMDMVELVQGQRIVSLSRRAKYLLMDMANGQVVIMHLGMSGSFRVEDGAPLGEFHHARSRLKAHDHVVFHLTTQAGDRAQVIYNDPRRFGFMLMCPRANLDDHPSFKSLGVEPVGNALSGSVLASLFENKKVPLKAALLDQRLIAGLGNIYVCEALWRSGLSPKRKAATLVRKSGAVTQRAERLAQNVRAVIAEAIEAGGSSLRDHAQTDGTLGYFQHRFAAYDREGHDCSKADCPGTIKRIVQSGRSTFYCPTCQR
ncbi:MAG: bifunctional DNA-formamidopyrimidine glycosylase/DNA-(apurinic or apyrimidinic site) lyase [Pseudomonadota bacterium]